MCCGSGRTELHTAIASSGQEGCAPSAASVIVCCGSGSSKLHPAIVSLVLDQRGEGRFASGTAVRQRVHRVVWTSCGRGTTKILNCMRL